MDLAQVHSQHFILIGNYQPDGQESMLRFTDLLARGLRKRGATVEIIAPRRVLLGRHASGGKGVAKWLGYFDKWILFPQRLRRTVRKKHQELGNTVRYHVCDHSNAPYLACLPPGRAGITCHDVLAIRGALGDPAAYCRASRMGVILQQWILKHLRRAPRVACISELTLQHLREISGTSESQPGWRVIHNAFNAEFKKMEPSEASGILKQHGHPLPKPFLLHVGSNLPRKNRRMLLLMVASAGQRWQGDICFAGEPVDAALVKEAALLGLQSRIHSVSKPDHQTLCALYSRAHAFVFPSFSEGFGWPLIEAQACGTPVIASSLEPFPEVGGAGALYADPHDASSFATALQTLAQPGVRESLVAKGFENATRFEVAPMIDGYLDLHGLNRTAPVPALVA